MTTPKSSSKPAVRRTLSAAEMHQRVMAGVAHEAATSSANTVRVLKVETDFKGLSVKAKSESKTGAKVTAQRVGVEVIKSGAPKAKGPPPVGLLLPGTYSADEYQIMIRDAGRRQMVEPGTNTPQFYPNGSPKMMVDPMARVVDEIKAISGFCGYLLPHMEGSKEAGPHGVQLANANRQAYRLASTGRGSERMSHGAFPLPAEAATTKAHTRCSAVVAGYVHGMPDQDRKLILDYLKREELTAFNFRMHEAAAEAALAKLEADLEGTDADELDRLIAHHETQREVERQRLVEIRRVLASKGVNIAPSMLERDTAGETDELSVPSANVPKKEYVGCDDECQCAGCQHEDLITALDAGKNQEVAAPVAVEVSKPEPLMVDEDGCIIEKPLSIEEQIAALKAANAALRGEISEPASKGSRKSKPPVEVKPIIDVDAIKSDADLLAALESL